MESLKKITTDEFLEKYDNNNLTDEDLEAIYFQRTFVDTEILTVKKLKQENITRYLKQFSIIFQKGTSSKCIMKQDLYLN